MSYKKCFKKNGNYYYYGYYYYYYHYYCDYYDYCNYCDYCDYKHILWSISRDEAVNRLNNFVLEDKGVL